MKWTIFSGRAISARVFRREGLSYRNVGNFSRPKGVSWTARAFQTKSGISSWRESCWTWGNDRSSQVTNLFCFFRSSKRVSRMTDSRKRDKSLTMLGFAEIRKMWSLFDDWTWNYSIPNFPRSLPFDIAPED